MLANGPTTWQPWDNREGGERGINHTPRKPQAESRQSKAILSCIFMAKQGAAAAQALLAATEAIYTHIAI